MFIGASNPKILLVCASSFILSCIITCGFIWIIPSNVVQVTMRHESWNRFCQNTSNRLAIEALQLFKVHLNDNRHDDQPGCGREFLDSICLGIRRKFELSLSQRYFVPKEDCGKFHLSKG